MPDGDKRGRQASQRDAIQQPRDRAELPPQVLAQIQASASISGPLPPPQWMEAYARIDPTFPERVFAMAEKNADHRRNLEQFVTRRNSRRADWGVVCGFVIAVSGLTAAVVTTLQGHDAVGGVIGGATLTELASTFVFGTVSRRRERQEKNQRLQT